MNPNVPSDRNGDCLFWQNMRRVSAFRLRTNAPGSFMQAAFPEIWHEY
jgi:hypothetical protein